MDITKAHIDGRMVDVVSSDEYIRLASLGDDDLIQNMCIQKDNTLYPVYQSVITGKQTPYVTPYEWGMVYRNRDNNEGYESDKAVNLSNVKSSEELIAKQEELHKAEMTTLLANSGEAFTPVIREEDSPALKLVKECLYAKHININNYKGRFDSGCDFSNTIRLLTNDDNHSISIQKMQLIGEKFDIKFKIIASDANNAPNPMRERISKEL